MNRVDRISTNALGAIVALEAIVFGIFIGLKLGFSFEPPSTLSSIATLGGNHNIIGTVAALVFIPIFALQIRGGFSAAVIFTSITMALTIVSIIDLLFITSGVAAKAPVAIVMLIFQAFVWWFSHKSWQETAKTHE